MNDAIQAFFLSKGFAGGLIGSFLILAASYFVKVPFGLREARWHRKVLFLVAGGLVGAVVFEGTKENAEALYFYVAVGAGWPWVVLSFANVAKNYQKGKEQAAIEGVNIEALVQQELEKMKAEVKLDDA